MGRASTHSATQLLRLVLVPLVLWYCSAVVQCLSLTIDRATSDTLLFEVTCKLCEGGNFTWEYKSQPEEPWGFPPKLNNHLFNQHAFYLTGLRENKQHYVRVRHNPSGKYSNEVEEWTCEKQLPPLTQLRVADAGVGWLDIRWALPHERCKSFYYYYVRYKPLGGEYTPVKKFGYFDVSKSKAFVRPSHPCSSKEFCVLLTDHVVAGQTHQIELQVERIGWLVQEEKSEKLWLTGHADTKNTGAMDFIACPREEKHPEKSSQEEKNSDRSSAGDPGGIPNASGGVVVPLWVAVVLGAIFFVILATIIGLWVKCSIVNAPGEEKKTDEVPLPPAEYMEERYVDPGELVSSTNSKKTSDYDDDAPVYEEVSIYLSTQSDNNFSSASFPCKH